MPTHDQVAAEPTVTLDIDGRRPVSAELVAEVEAFNARAADAACEPIAVIRLTGKPDQWRRGDLGVQLVNKWEQALRRLERLNVATVAIAEGEIGGVAVEALLSTDYRIGAADLMLNMSNDQVGVWPGMGVYRLASQVGIARVRRTVLFGAPVSAAKALEMSLLDEIATDPDAALASVVNLVTSYSGTELAIRRQLMLDATTTSFEDALGRHLAACDRALRRATPVAVNGAVPT